MEIEKLIASEASIDLLPDSSNVLVQLGPGQQKREAAGFLPPGKISLADEV